MGYTMNRSGWEDVVRELSGKYRLWAPVLKVGEGRFTDTDIIRYEYVTEAGEMELDTKSDYSFKDVLLPLSETLFYFTENEVKEADRDDRPVLVFLRSCDLHAVRRLDQLYLDNGRAKDIFYEKKRDRIKFVLIGCPESNEDCFCVSMGTNRSEDGYVFSVDHEGDVYRFDVKDPAFDAFFQKAGGRPQEVVPAYVTENQTKVSIPEKIDNTIYKAPLWDEYSSRCIGCGRCNLVCPTCTCFTMQDIYYTDNGKVGERRRVNASCMIDGYTNVAGGGQYRRSQGERMRFKVLHKIYDFRRRFGYDMCVGCGRCDAVCPEYISFPKIIEKVGAAVAEGKEA